MIRPGTYALFISFDRDIETRIGALGVFGIPKGEYCYIGSAKSGLDQRIRRHMRKEKILRWHIDFITIYADKMEAYGYDAGECELRMNAESFGMRPFIKGFGCSDCRCDTHLLVSDERSKRMMTENAKMCIS